MSLFRKVAWIRLASLFTYSGLLVFPPLFHGWAVYKRKTAKLNLIHAFVISGVAGSLLYQICPAMGPAYAFTTQFPDHLPVLTEPTRFLTTGVFNAMPSLHITWMLLVWVAAWELGSFAVAVASVFLTFTGFATVGYGEHYLIDLIVATPLVLMVTGICTKCHRLTAVGTVLVLMWTIYLRTGIQMSSAFNWILVIATLSVVTALIIKRKYDTIR